jgi:hypothetical protein
MGFINPFHIRQSGSLSQQSGLFFELSDTRAMLLIEPGQTVLGQRE